MENRTQFRARRLDMRMPVAPLNVPVDVDTLLWREVEMRQDFTAALTLSVPMRQGAEDFGELWNGPFRTPQMLELEHLWRDSDGTQLLVQVATAYAHTPSVKLVEPKRRPLLRRLVGPSPVKEVREVPGKAQTHDLFHPVDRNVMTEDGHVWFAASVSYVAGSDPKQGGLVSVLFPYLRKGTRELMRPMLMFTTGSVTDADCAYVVASLVLGFQKDAESERRRRAA